MSIQYNLP